MESLHGDLDPREVVSFIDCLGDAGMTAAMVRRVNSDPETARAIVFTLYRRGLFPREVAVTVDGEAPLASIVEGLRDGAGYNVHPELLRYARTSRRHRFRGGESRLVRLFEYPEGGLEFASDDAPSPLDVTLTRMERDGFEPADLRMLLALDRHEPFLKYRRTLVALGSPRRLGRSGNVYYQTLYAPERESGFLSRPSEPVSDVIFMSVL